VGTILSLADWIRDSGQWTATERGRLQALTEHFPGGGDLEVVFGATDDGAPWCAVMNGEGEVLVHVARLANQFLVHVAGEEVVSRGDNLRDALGRWLRPEPDRPGVVVPFGRLRSGVDIMILVAVVALLEETLRHHAGQGMDGVAWSIADAPILEAKAPTEHLAPIAPETASHALRHGLGDNDVGGSAERAVAALTPPPIEADVSPLAVARPAAVAPAAAPAQVAQEQQTIWRQAQGDTRADGPAALLVQIHGTSGDDVLIGGAEAEHLVGGDGDDVLIGGGGRDVLEGGAGDDWIVLTSEALASGGGGADTFVISAPKVMDHAETLLGTILDYSTREGDRLVTAKGEAVGAPPSNEPVETPKDARGGQKIEVDLDGNGHIDGYVLIAPQGDAAPAEPGFDPCVIAPCESWSGWTDIIG